MRRPPAATLAGAQSVRSGARKNLRALADLDALRQALTRRAAQQERERAQTELTQQRATPAGNLFAQAVGPVQPLRAKQRAPLKIEPAGIRPLERARDEALVLQQAFSDDFDVATLLEVDEHLSFRRFGIGADVTRKLRAGQWSIQRQIDLHGLRSDEAREALGRFLRTALLHGLRCVRVVHGKGLGSPGKAAILKHKVPRWLAQRQEVLAFVQARPAHGGAGALLVLLQAAQSGRRAGPG